MIERGVLYTCIKGVIGLTERFEGELLRGIGRSSCSGFSRALMVGVCR